MGKFIQMSDATRNKLIETSERYNSAAEHYRVITSVSTMTQDDASYIISKLTELNEYKAPINKLVSFRDKELNRSISRDPENYKKDLERSGTSNPYIANLRKMFTRAMKQKDYPQAAIAYLTLKYDEKDAAFIKGVSPTNPKVVPFLKWLNEYEKKVGKLHV